MNRAIAAALAIAAMVGCKEDGQMAGSSAVSFVSEGIATRTAMGSDYDVTWKEGDKVGIYTQDLSSDYANSLHEAQSSGASTAFEPLGSPIYLEDGDLGKVNFYAYYPYSSTMVDSEALTIKHKLTTPTTQEEFVYGDLLFAAASKSYTAANKSDNVALAFDHALSMATFTITHDLSSIDQVSINNIPTQASYSLTDGTLISSESLTSLDLYFDNNVAYAMLHPTELASSVLTIYGKLANGEARSFNINIPDFTLAAANLYKITIKIENEEASLGTCTITPWEDREKQTLYPTISTNQR